MPFTLVPLSKTQLLRLEEAQGPEEIVKWSKTIALHSSTSVHHAVDLTANTIQDIWSQIFIIVRIADSAFVGACGFKTWPKAGRVEVGYAVLENARSQGAATSALRLLCSLACSNGVNEIVAEVLPSNLSSIRVLEKAGFVEVGTRTDENDKALNQWIWHSGA